MFCIDNCITNISILTFCYVSLRFVRLLIHANYCNKSQSMFCWLVIGMFYRVVLRACSFIGNYRVFVLWVVLCLSLEIKQDVLGA